MCIVLGHFDGCSVHNGFVCCIVHNGSAGKIIYLVAFNVSFGMRLWHARKSSLELCDQCRESFRLFIRCEVTAGQALDLDAEFTEAFLGKVNLPMFKGIFVAATHQERKLIAISLEKLTEIEPFTLRFVISHEACGGGEVEQAVVAVQGAVELAKLGVRYVVAFRPHFPDSWHPLEQCEGTAQASPGPIGEAAQRRRGIPWVGMPVRKEPAIEDENAANVRPARRFTSFSQLKPAAQMLQHDERGKIKGD